MTYELVITSTGYGRDRWRLTRSDGSHVFTLHGTTEDVRNAAMQTMRVLGIDPWREVVQR